MTKYFISICLISLASTTSANSLLNQQATNSQVQSIATAKQTEQAKISKLTVLRLVDQRDLDENTFKQALSQADSELSIYAIQGAGRIGGEKAVELVAEKFTDSREKVRRAVAFALGIAASQKAAPILWQQLDSEKSPLVRKEIYLALGNLAETDIVAKLLNHYRTEQNPQVVAGIFQALTFSVTYHPEIADNIDMRKNQSIIDFSALLSLLERDDEVSYQVGYFLARLKQIEKRISPAQLQKFTFLIKDNNNKKVIAKLIGKVAKKKHLANRRLLSWLIEQSESNDIGLATESIRAMGKLLYIPQAKIQLGKLQASKNDLIAVTALNTLAESSLEGREINALFKKQLKNNNPGIVVEAIRGLLHRQERDEMSWALNILSHQSTYVKIRFAQMIFDKDPIGFDNVLKMLAKNNDPEVAIYANNLQKTAKKPNESALLTPQILSIKDISNHLIELNTTRGNITIQLNNQAIYTGLNFIRLVQSGYYDNTYFSRVIGNFVAQGGDSIGDGNGGSLQTIREEISYLSHLSGSVGMATAGKDTGDSQFFINLADNTHLDRHYTVFGQVESGMELALRLSNGDQILSAKIVE